MTDFLNYILAIADFLYAHFLPLTQEDYFMAYTLLIFCCVLVAVCFVFLLAFIPFMFKNFISAFRRIF